MAVNFVNLKVQQNKSISAVQMVAIIRSFGLIGFWANKALAGSDMLFPGFCYRQYISLTKLGTVPSRSILNVDIVKYKNIPKTFYISFNTLFPFVTGSATEQAQGNFFPWSSLWNFWVVQVLGWGQLGQDTLLSQCLSPSRCINGYWWIKC